MRWGYEVWIYAGALGASAIAHVALIGGLSSAARNQVRERPKVVEMALVTPPPEPIPEPEPVAPVEVEEPKPKPPPPKKKEIVEPPPPETPPPSNTEAPPEPTESAPPVFGVTMSSTVQGGDSGMKVRVGNTLMKDPENEFTKADEVKPYAGPPKKSYVPPSQVSKMARPRGECRGDYPEEAKRLGIEGKVRLLITIEKDGTVSTVKVLKGLGYGLDEVAKAAIGECEFDPAYKDGEPVAIKVPYTYTFQLDEF